MTLSEQQRNYVHWLQERGMRWPSNPQMQTPAARESQPPAAATPSTQPAISLGVLFLHDEADSSPEALALFSKMTAAMKLAHDHFKLLSLAQCDTEAIKSYQPRMIVLLGQSAIGKYFDKTTLGQWLTHELFSGVPCICTYHPSLLLQVPELKRAAWQHCQLIMAKVLHD